MSLAISVTGFIPLKMRIPLYLSLRAISLCKYGKSYIPRSTSVVAHKFYNQLCRRQLLMIAFRHRNKNIRGITFPSLPYLPVSLLTSQSQQCQQRKVKCDKLTPCKVCSTRGSDCVYRAPAPPRVCDLI